VDVALLGGPDGRIGVAAGIPVFGGELAGDEGRALRIGNDGHPDPRGIERRADDVAAQLRGPFGDRVGVVDRERDAPVRWDVGLVVGNRVHGRDHVLETLRSAGLRHSPAEPGIVLLQEVAVALFAEQGYAATTIESIARDAGLAVQTFYATFGSKRSVLFALLDEMEDAADIHGLIQDFA